MKSLNHSATVDLPANITGLSVNFNSIDMKVGKSISLHLYPNLVAALSGNVIYEINAQGLDLANVNIGNPNTVIMSAAKEKVKVNISNLVPPLSLTGVINSVKQSKIELDAAG